MLIMGQNVKNQNKVSIYLELIFLCYKYLRYVSLQFPILIRNDKCETKIQILIKLTSRKSELLSDNKFLAGAHLNQFNWWYLKPWCFVSQPLLLPQKPLHFSISLRIIKQFSSGLTLWFYLSTTSISQ